MSIKIGSGDTNSPSIWANTLNAGTTDHSLGLQRPTILTDSNSLYIVVNSAGSQWSNTQNRVLIFEFDKLTGELITQRSIGRSDDTADFNVGENLSEIQKVAGIDNVGRITTTGYDAAKSVMVTVDQNDSYAKDVEINLGTNMLYANLCCNTGTGSSMITYGANNYVEICDTSTTPIAGGTFNGFTHVWDVTFGGSWAVTGLDSAGGVDKCAIETYNNSGTSTGNLKWYDPAYATTGDEHRGKSVTYADNGVWYVAWDVLDQSALQYTANISRVAGNLAGLNWTKQIQAIGSFPGRPTTCMAPDQSGIISLWHNGSTMRINQLNVTDGTEEVDLAVTSVGSGIYGNLVAGSIASDSDGIYLAMVQNYGTYRNALSVMKISQADFEAWTTEQYGEFDGDGTYGWTNTTINPTESAMSNTGIGGTGGTYSSTSTVDIDTESLMNETRTTY